jgi:hypothetical protein
MPETQSFLVTGTEAEIEAFLRSLQYIPEIDIVSKERIERKIAPGDEAPLGAQEIVDVLIHFSVALGAHATWELIVHQFNRFRGDRTHMKIQGDSEQRIGDEEEAPE